MSDSSCKDDKLSLDATLEAAVASIKSRYPDISGKHLDIGSGTGNLIRRIRQEYDVESLACDYTDTFMELDDVRMNVVDLNDGELPYPDQHFDLITFTEVAEHLENYRAVVREIYRILKPGGVVVITTPNVLNMKSLEHVRPAACRRDLHRKHRRTYHPHPLPVSGPCADGSRF
jgi:ubiquinone/menaquinone biosynthesis C-methylase UbiE